MFLINNTLRLNILYSLLSLSLLSFFSSPVHAQLSLLDKKQSTTCVDRDFVVMAHIVRDTFQAINTNPQAIAEALDIVNEWFAPICVRFNLAEVDTIDNFQYSMPESFNELDQLWRHHNDDNRINLYVVTDVGLVSPDQVFATEGGILQTNSGGILINFQALNQSPVWLVHGFGHYCGLLHTNTDFGSELVDGSNCETTGDEICDTPADPLDPSAPLGGLGTYFDLTCRFIYNGLDPNGEYYLTQTGNAMSRYPSGCWCGLTFEQFERMALFIAQSRLW